MRLIPNKIQFLPSLNDKIFHAKPFLTIKQQFPKILKIVYLKKSELSKIPNKKQFFPYFSGECFHVKPGLKAKQQFKKKIEYLANQNKPN